MATAANEKYFLDPNTQLEAEGYQWREASHGRGRTLVTTPDPDAPKGFVFERTGGLEVRRRVHLSEADTLYRFAARKYIGKGAPGLEPLLNSPWWMELERMVLLLSRAREAAVRLAEMARRQLALPLAWTDCDIVVRAKLKPGVLLGAHAGPGRTATVPDQVRPAQVIGGLAVPARRLPGTGESRIIAPEAPHLLMDQLYIPGLGRLFSLQGAGAGNVKAWFDLTSMVAIDPEARGLNP
jgi:hypothetical protein